MDSPESSADSGTTSPSTSPHKVVVVVAVGCLILVATFFGRQHFIKRADSFVFDSAPKPRPRLNAPFITSADVVVDKMVELAQVTKDDLVYDLGCGDGRIIVTAALQSGCQGIGFDIDPERVAEANTNVELHDVARLVTIKQQDIFKVDLSEADVALMYLLPWMMQKLTSQFEQMKPGSRIVSHDFYIEGVEPERVVQVQIDSQSSQHMVFLYTTPLKWNPRMPRKPPTEGIADRADAEKAALNAAEKSTNAAAENE